VTEAQRAIGRLEAYQLKLVATPDDAGAAAREVALATELEPGHDATTEAPDQGPVSPGHAAVTLAPEARRLACVAGLIPAVLGTGSVTLDLGHQTRLFTEAQRIATAPQHPTCTTEGCQRPHAWRELHHQRPWTKRDRTNLNHATPPCHHHHQHVHDTAHNHRHLPDGDLRFSRRT
jgi:hypothetical protein